MSEAAVQTLFDVMGSMPAADDDALSRALQGAGLREAVAERALAFVPMACARVVLRGAQFPDVYLIPARAAGAYERHRLEDDAIFVAALGIAERLGGASPNVIRAAARSAEMQVATQLLGPGASVEDIGFTEPVVLRLARIPPARRSWWRFW